MGFRNFREYAEAFTDDGASHTQFIHKTSAPTSVGAGRWVDLSVGAGIPKINAYVGPQAKATPFVGSGNDGIYTGPAPAAGQTKHLHEVQIQSTSTTIAPALVCLLDYLMHYPIIEGDNTDPQDMDNTLTLPRYASGEGVRCMAVCTTPMSANANCTVSYTNSDGVAGRTSTFTLIASTVTGGIITSADTSGAAGSVTPYMPLANGDKGIRSIDSITLSTGAGGFFALVLVKPLTAIQLRENFTAHEMTQILQRASVPEIVTGAYLNLIALSPVSGTAATLRGELTFVWR